jgi:Ice-binding-like
VRRMLFNVRFLGLVFLALLAGVWPMAAQAATAPTLGSAANFAVLSAAPGGGGAVTCTGGTITGNVGSSGPMASVVQTGCTITGAIIAPVSAQVLTDFNGAYDALGAVSCGQTLTGTLAGVTLTPGVYCFSAAATLTGTLTLAGPANGIWTFKIGSGTPPTGALTGTSFSVVMAGGGLPCNVNWWVAQAATMTDSQFVGTILAGAAITLTRGTFSGNALAKAGVTITGTSLVGCAAAAGGKGHGKEKKHCNQGVGNGPEGCDPGNSNHRHTSNDELGGTPGHPGRQGGNRDGAVAAKVASNSNSNGSVEAKGNSSLTSNGTVAAKGNSSLTSNGTVAANGKSNLNGKVKSRAKAKSKSK